MNHTWTLLSISFQNGIRYKTASKTERAEFCDLEILHVWSVLYQRPIVMHGCEQRVSETLITSVNNCHLEKYCPWRGRAKGLIAHLCGQGSSPSFSNSGNTSSLLLKSNRLPVDNRCTKGLKLGANLL